MSDDDDDSPVEHPFAQYVRKLGRGQRGARPLTQDEARHAMRMILDGEATPEQIGAFLMLMRIKEETPEELAGIVQSARANLQQATPFTPAAVLDWSAYAGKRRQLPWFVLSALLLAHHGIPVLLHGLAGRADGRVYLRRTMTALQIPEQTSLNACIPALQQQCFAFITLDVFSPPLTRLLQLRDFLGLRSPLHSAVRMLNPLNAPYSFHGIFHPGYDARHQHAAVLMGQPHLAVLKGDGGEAERNPDQPADVYYTHEGQTTIVRWPALYSQRHLKEPNMDPALLLSTWRGETNHEYGVAATCATAAIALHLLGKASTPDEGMALATSLWNSRPQTSPLPPVSI